jgi:hypothetical protein
MLRKRIRGVAVLVAFAVLAVATEAASEVEDLSTASSMLAAEETASHGLSEGTHKMLRTMGPKEKAIFMAGYHAAQAEAGRQNKRLEGAAESKKEKRSTKSATNSLPIKSSRCGKFSRYCSPVDMKNWVLTADRNRVQEWKRIMQLWRGKGVGAFKTGPNSADFNGKASKQPQNCLPFLDAWNTAEKEQAARWCRKYVAKQTPCSVKKYAALYGPMAKPTQFSAFVGGGKPFGAVKQTQKQKNAKCGSNGLGFNIGNKPRRGWYLPKFGRCLWGCTSGYKQCMRDHHTLKFMQPPHGSSCFWQRDTKTFPAECGAFLEMNAPDRGTAGV